MSDLIHPVIAIDGTAASGKSTFSRELARRLGYVYVNTGAMYRGVTWYLQQRNIPLRDAEAVARVVEAAGVETRLSEGELVFRIAGLDPLPHVREGRVNEGVSLVAQIAAVRRILVAEQQSLAAQAPLVMEGRDIGTVVFPQTPYKFYLDANAEVRAQRRSRQGENDVIRERDILDQQRENSPLTRAPDALCLDSGHASVEELIAVALQHLASGGLKMAS
ncbi:MAG TPA: (d)CMP kinase [Candidatus Methylacidiphilales bacterium]|jgi:cytidylate kinase|nr:(d)CMP kinase [Candidatus Methylacidiphilales bacterium]